MSEQGAPEFERARRKAVARTGITDRRDWPSNEEIQEALVLQRRLFADGGAYRRLRALRRQCLEAMHSFEVFTPRLVGPVLAGTATPDLGIELHLFAENPEEVVMALIERSIPWREHDASFRYAGGVMKTHPILTFVAGSTPVQLAVLPPQARHNPPLSPVTDRPDRGADATEVRRLIDEGG